MCQFSDKSFQEASITKSFILRKDKTPALISTINSFLVSFKSIDSLAPAGGSNQSATAEGTYPPSYLKGYIKAKF